jgi:hypothetical protein
LYDTESAANCNARNDLYGRKSVITDRVVCLSCSVRGEDDDDLGSTRRHSDTGHATSLFTSGPLTNGLHSIPFDDEITDVSVELFPSAGVGGDSDDDSTESGFSEQDVPPALDS